MDSDEIISQSSNSEPNELIRTQDEKIENLKSLLTKSRNLILNQKQIIAGKIEEIEKLKGQNVKLEEMMEKYLSEEKPKRIIPIFIIQVNFKEITARVRINNEIWCLLLHEDDKVYFPS